MMNPESSPNTQQTQGKRKPVGTAVLENGIWTIQAKPNVIILIKRVLPRANESLPGVVRIRHSPQSAQDLYWISQRFPLEFTCPTPIEQLAQEHENLLEELHSILCSQKTRDYDLAIPPRNYQKIAAEIHNRQGHLLLADEVGLGKALAINALMLTPKGWKRIGELQVGDKIMGGSSGKTQIVTGVYPQGKKLLYRITFDDKSSTLCCAEHLWNVKDDNDHLRGKPWRTLTTEEILQTNLRVAKINSRNRWEIPLPPVLEFEEEALLVDPYLLGVLLGNGCLLETPSLSTRHAEQLEKIRPLLPEDVAIKGPYPSDPNKYHLTSGRGGGKNPLTKDLQKIGVWGRIDLNKSIPHQYLFSSPAQRLSLLQGLLDTDGRIPNPGRVRFSSSSLQLAEDCAFLARSLGGWASISTTPPQPLRTPHANHIVVIQLPNLEPFALEYHKKRMVPSKIRPRRTIVSIVPEIEEEAVCISTDDPKRLYLTDDLIVTHNTVTSLTTISLKERRPAIIVTPAHLCDQWKAFAKRFLPEIGCQIAKTSKPHKLKPNTEILILSYSKLAGWVTHLGESEVNTLIFDEIQDLRRPESKKYQAAKTLRAHAKSCLGNSASPVTNYGGEMFHLLEIVAPGQMGSETEFKREWCSSTNNGKWIIRDPKALGSHLQNEMLVLRRTRQDVKRELPSIIKTVHTVPFRPEILKETESASLELARIILEGSFTERGQAARTLDLKLRQSTGLAKAPFTAEFAKMFLEEDTPVILTGWHHAVYDVWKTILGEYNPVFYTGEQSSKEKNQSKEAFLSGESKLFILSLRSGLGLDGLQDVCSTIIHGELDWSRSFHHQSDGRIHRDGQKNPVSAIYLVAEGGSDPIISQILGIKSLQAQGIVDPLLDPLEGKTPQEIEEIEMERFRKLAEHILHTHKK